MKMMLQRFIFISFLILSQCVLSQEVINWTYDYNKESSTIVLNAKMQAGWHLYSQHINDGIGPVPTAFSFEDNNFYKLLGKVEEPKPITEYDSNFEGELSFFTHEVSFTQKIKVKNSGDVNLTITFMACNDEMCLPPEDKLFTVSIEK